MRKAIALLLIVCQCEASPFNFVQAKTCTAAANSCSIAMTTTAGNLLVVGNCAIRGTVNPSLTIARTGDTFTTANSALDGGSSGTTASLVQYVASNAGGSNNITVSRTGAANQLIAGIAAEYKGVMTQTTQAHDNNNQANVTGTLAVSGTFADLYSPELLIGFLCSTTAGGTMTPGNTMTSESQVTTNVHAMLEDAIQYQSVASTQTVATTGSSVNNTMNGVGFVIVNPMLPMF